MLIKYVKSSWLYLRNNRVFTTINLVGLTVSLTVCFFIFLYVNFEWHYDAFNVNRNHIYRLVTDVKTAGSINYESASAPMGPAIKASFPEVKEVARLLLDNLILQKDEKLFADENIAYADSSLFSVFTLPLLEGNPKEILNAPFQIVLSQTYARKYFGNDEAVGKTLLVDGKFPALVTGVMKDMPYNSHFRTDVLVSMSTLLTVFSPGRSTNWNSFGMYTYLLLNNNSNVAALTQKINRLVNSNNDDKQVSYSLSLERLRDVYLLGKPRGFRAGSEVSGSIQNIYIFSIIAILILFIAAFNFINLTTAFSLKRTKEIGVRKVLGASRKQLVLQLLSDAVLLSCIACLATIVLCSLLLPLFNEIAGKIVCTSVFQQPLYIVALFAVAVVTGILSGCYPAFYLSSFRPVNTLKGQFVSGEKGVRLREILVVSQFVASVFLIVSTIVIYTQLHYMQNEDLGFEKQHNVVIDFHFDDKIRVPRETVRHQLLGIKGVTDVGYSSCIPGKANVKLHTGLQNRAGQMQEDNFDLYSFDEHFLKQYGVQLLAGRNVSDLSATDSVDAMLINEAAAKKLGYQNPAEAVGKSYTQFGESGIIIGVINNFHFHSFEETIQPLIVQVNPWRYTYLTVSIAQTDIAATVASIAKKCKKLAPALPFSYSFSDTAYNTQYLAQEHFGQLFICLASVAIFVSCLGLLGLFAFTVVQRTKEIGIRKVLGATIGSVIILLSQNFFNLIILSFAIAIPLSYLFMNHWLLNFAYRISIRWWMFAAAGVLVLLIALLTIGFSAIRVAMANPVKSLRSE